PAQIYTLSLHDALPISGCLGRVVSCTECHVSTAPPEWNVFGQALIAALPRDRGFEEALPVALASEEAGDADGDGDTNLEEIRAGDRKSTRLNSSHVKSS